jgi:hypothetical protein
MKSLLVALRPSGALEPGERAAVDAHLVTCEGCQAELATDLPARTSHACLGAETVIVAAMVRAGGTLRLPSRTVTRRSTCAAQELPYLYRPGTHRKRHKSGQGGGSHKCPRTIRHFPAHTGTDATVAATRSLAFIRTKRLTEPKWVVVGHLRQAWRRTSQCK